MARKSGGKPRRRNTQGNKHPSRPPSSKVERKSSRQDAPDLLPTSGRPRRPAAKTSRPPRTDAPRYPETPSPALMRRIFADCDFEVTDLQLNQFWQFYLRLKERNQEINLTRIHRFEDVVIKHFVDCAMVGRLTTLPESVVDIGSGGGFPGVPLKIFHPETAITLAEGRRLRVEFLEEVRRCLRLPKLYIYGHQVHPSYGDVQLGATTRAVESVGKTLARVRGCLGIGGRVILMKGPKVNPELREAAKEFAGEYKLVEDHDYLLPTTDHQRRLVVYERLVDPAPNQNV